jgi:hypothetical protein
MERRLERAECKRVNRIFQASVANVQQRQATASRAALQAGRCASLGALDNPAVGGAQERKEWSVGLITPSATESTCSHEHISQIVNKAKPSQAELRGA